MPQTKFMMKENKTQKRIVTLCNGKPRWHEDTRSGCRPPPPP